MAIIPRTNLGLFLTATPFIVIVVYIVFSLLNEDDGVLMGNATNPVFALAAAILAFALYWFTRKSPSPEINLGLVVAFTLLALGELTWSIYAEVIDEEVTVSLADLFWLSGYVALIALLFKVIRDAKVKISRQIIAVQAAFWLAVSPLLIYVVRESYGSTDMSTLEKVTWNLYTPLDAVILSLVIMLIWSFRKGLLEDCWIIVGVSIAFYTVGDSLYTIYEASGAYSVGSMPDVFYIGSYAMLSLGFGMLLLSSARFPSVEPAPETYGSKEAMRELAPRNTYVIWSTDSRRGYELIVQGLSQGLEGLIITRKPPSMIKPTYGLKKTAMIWLSTSPGSEAIHPANTGILTGTIVRFLEKGKNSIILVDGFESIVTYADFKKALTTLDHLKDLIVAHNSRLIVTVDKRTLTEREAALIEKRAVLIQG
ncbi:MAG: DUF835 domain-containing protein [Thermoplasmatota archaeon]|nr:DUF835 domain-containing protein [Candidatus Thermoplasmatota archaeon]MBU1914830.1 DUF835 domain-containing protein [Candidatus Thermoplasmatota archaeon]